MSFLKGKHERALEYAERCPLALVDVDSPDASLDPNLLYWYVVREHSCIFCRVCSVNHEVSYHN
jgi:hypothetical protein